MSGDENVSNQFESKNSNMSKFLNYISYDNFKKSVLRVEIKKVKV